MDTTRPAYQNLELQPLAGQWRAGSSGRPLEVFDPYNDELLLRIALASREDLDAAYRKARDSQREWATTAPAERARVLLEAVKIFDERREEIIDWIIRESGSTRIKAQIEWGAARAITLESASLPNRVHGRIIASNISGKESRVYRAPLGVIGVISPWNFPLHLTARSLAPALALGNAVVVKPASDTPITGGLLLARIFEEAGLPAGVLSVVVGSGAEIGDAFVEHPVPALISFTGSTQVGRNIGRIASGGEHLKHVALELGGNSPFVVLADADVEQAVNAAVVGKFLHQGQICMAINRIIVEQPLLEDFTRRFVERVKALPYGDPSKPGTVVGPVINARQLAGLKEKIATAKAEGATLLLGGEPQGNVMPPHVFGNVTADMEIAREEIFGPLVGIQSARDAEHALELANSSEYGLSSAVFTASLERGVQFARRIHAGMTHVNDIPVNDEPNAPFGGEKNSGLGRFNGDWAIEEFTTDHWITLQHSPRPYPF
ncbi:TPA: aldehyde dehydrogenase family protein [Pseudomonas aeruginosa]|jgi:aldehyde dehydrogenase (NAD+)|uniref:p-hydroxybenzaldehyde dehydrogenase n=1 Tax=Ectopseudomonas mendocina TaxID=300 RepID=Q8KP43_ECTME|nr:4-hydroxybenzaldehyde dehydrogenase [Pseudomonas aeruginosa]AAM92190.1 p-hydroxybenzaldehyde dehydrogenase [Pseudomonas mendocina]MBG4378395.1 aldehyde dehydrogenase family protein [Pseudomonas aeruginosa]MBI8227222.1 aldehyde dehydrogenase family protein [Pseudomonas aeruginosa]MCT5070591.1 aldehyde dehydrogenase family protein [Pseudomonas aeruginosa]MDP5707313.1 aldehyde dehydrogenase family protein [Pseudomonas aeruginosa]